VAPEDVLKIHSPLVTATLAQTAGLAAGNELDLLEQKKKTEERLKATAKGKR
jgi:hypothetical protein